MKFLLGLLALLMSGVPMGSAQTFAYLSGQNGPELDVYSFESARDAPIVIYVHGGAWMIGDKRQVRDKPVFFNANGYVFVSVNYTLVPKGTVEGQFSEIDAALGFVAENAARFGGDAGNISLMGHSAGAHLVTMAVVDPGPQVRGLLAQGALRAVIVNDTIAYDIARIAQNAGGRLPRLYRRPFSEDPARWAALSPASYVAGSQNLPRFLLTHSAQGDAAARARGVHEFASLLAGAGAEVRVFDGQAYNHMQISRAIGVEADISGAIIEFLRAQ